MTQTTGVILFAHGSRDPLWRLPIDAVAEHMRGQQTSMPVAVAFLELTEPDLPSAVEALMKQDVAHVRILPMFLGVGRHAREDLPALMAALQAEHPEVRFELMRPAGEDERLTALLAELALEDRA